MNEIKPAYAGEAMLLRWGENHNGRTLTLQLDEHVGAQHPFKSLKCGPSGQRMQVVCVLIGDDEEPIPPPQVGTKGASPSPAVKSENTSASIPLVSPQEMRETRKTPFRELKRAAQAALKCRDYEFAKWLCGDALGAPAPLKASDYEPIEAILKAKLEIESKTELDSNPEKGAAWDKLLASFDYRGRA